MFSVSSFYKIDRRLDRIALECLATLASQQPFEFDPEFAVINNIQVSETCLVLLDLAHVNLAQIQVRKVELLATARVLTLNTRLDTEAFALHVEIQRLVSSLTLDVAF